MRTTGAFILSVDFELLWGVRPGKTIDNYGRNILGARRAIPRLLDLFGRYDLACTWATVGLLFFEEKEALLATLPRLQPNYSKPALSPYHDEIKSVGANERSDPFHFGLSLIREVASRPRQEIATHTFSHFYCLEAGQTRAEFEADLDAAVACANDQGIALHSIVFPRNQVNEDYLPCCRSHGISVYRGTNPHWIYRGKSRFSKHFLNRALRLLDTYAPLSDNQSLQTVAADGLVNVPANQFLRPYSGRTALADPLKLHRIVQAMRQSARLNTTFHLWFHCHNFGVHQDENLSVLEAIAKEASNLRATFGWPSLTMVEAALAKREM